MDYDQNVPEETVIQWRIQIQEEAKGFKLLDLSDI